MANNYIDLTSRQFTLRQMKTAVMNTLSGGVPEIKITDKLEFVNPESGVVNAVVMWSADSRDLLYSIDGGLTYQSLTRAGIQWVQNNSYSEGDIVYWSYCLYAARASSSNVIPGSDPSIWHRLTWGMFVHNVTNADEFVQAIAETSSAVNWIIIRGSISSDVAAAAGAPVTLIYSDEGCSVAGNVNITGNSDKRVIWHSDGTSFAGGKNFFSGGNLYIDRMTVPGEIPVNLGSNILYQRIDGPFSGGTKVLWKTPVQAVDSSLFVPVDMSGLQDAKLTDDTKFYAGTNRLDGTVSMSGVTSYLLPKIGFRVDRQGSLAQRPDTAAPGFIYYDNVNGDLYVMGQDGWGDAIRIRGNAGPKGDNGRPFLIDASGSMENRSNFDSEASGFVYYVNASSDASEIGNVYFKMSSSPGDWSQGYPFLAGSNWFVQASEPAPETGANLDLFLNALTGDVYQKKDGTWSKVANIRGAKGDQGTTPHIDPDTGNWFIGEVDTGVQARGPAGVTPVIDPNTGFWVVNDEITEYPSRGPQGYTPYIGENKNWFINGEDTGSSSLGTIGSVLSIGANGNWYIDNVDTGVKAQGPPGPQGDEGKTPYINPENKHWMIGDQDTGVNAEATIGSILTIGENGNWYIDGVDTGVPASGGGGGGGGVSGTTISRFQCAKDPFEEPVFLYIEYSATSAFTSSTVLIDTLNRSADRNRVLYFNGSEWALFPSEGLGSQYDNCSVSVDMSALSTTGSSVYYIRYKWYNASTSAAAKVYGAVYPSSTSVSGVSSSSPVEPVDVPDMSKLIVPVQTGTKPVFLKLQASSSPDFSTVDLELDTVANAEQRSLVQVFKDGVYGAMPEQGLTSGYSVAQVDLSSLENTKSCYIRYAWVYSDPEAVSSWNGAVFPSSGGASSGTGSISVYDGLVFSGPYNAETVYTKPENGTLLAEYQGSEWAYISDTPGSGNAPPSLPVTENDHWQLFLSRGDTLERKEDMPFTSDDLVDGKLTVTDARLGSCCIQDPYGRLQMPDVTQNGADLVFDFSGWDITGTWIVKFNVGARQKSLYEIWSEQPENEGGTLSEYLEQVGMQPGSVTFNSIISGAVSFDGLHPVIGVLTNIGNYYPVEKGDVLFDTEQQRTYVVVYRFLVLDNVSEFTGTWTVFFSGTSAQATGESAYQIWLNAGNSGTVDDFLASMKGADGDSAYQVWLEAGNTGTVQDYIKAITGPKGDSQYIHMAYASDAAGSDFSSSYKPELKWFANIVTNSSSYPDETQFAGHFYKAVGDDGEPLSGSYADISEVDSNNRVNISEPMWIVGIQAPSGNTYPMEASAGLAITGSGTSFSLLPYMAYENMPTFSGTWRVYYSGGAAGKSVYQIWLDAGNEGSEADFIKDIARMQNTVASSVTVTSSYDADMSTADIFDITLTANTNCVLTISNAVNGTASVIRVTTASGSSLTYSGINLIDTTDTGTFLLTFAAVNGGMHYYGKAAEVI